ncbi:MAG: enoyl-CoA hydratase/isomerase family protein [Ilumatobacteraceae bacterium]
MAISEVLFDVDLAVARVTLNRAEKLNALDLAVLRRLREITDELQERSDVHVVVLSGNGSTFCAGADLAYIEEIRRDQELVHEFLFALRDAIVGFERLPQPVVAAVHGLVLAGGLELMMGCDLTVAARSTRLGDQHLNWGFVPGGGSTQRLTRWVGAARARDLIFTGRWITADEACDFGLISRVVPDEEVGTAALELAGELAKRSPQAMAISKRLIQRSEEIPLGEGLDREITEVAAYYLHPHFEQGLAGFKARTPPSYS